MVVISKEKIMSFVSEAYKVKFRAVRNKKIFFSAIIKDNKNTVICTPQSKYHPKLGAWWVDITQIQYDEFEKYDNAIIIFRLEGSMLCMQNWKSLKEYLNEKCRTYNDSEKEHWKLYIYNDYIKVMRNDNICNLEVKSCIF